jgi:hypothetical protein
MVRQHKGVLTAVTIAVFLASCHSEEGVVPTRGLAVTVDSAVYHLQPWPGGYAINLTATVVNDSDRDVFLSQDCGNWALARADKADTTALFLGDYGCALISNSLHQPRVIASGQRYSRSFRMTGSNSPLTFPPITIDNNTGTLVFWYQFTDPTGRPAGRVHSLPFRVEPPL